MSAYLLQAEIDTPTQHIICYTVYYLLQAKIDALTEQLRNAEDKLCAAEHCKKLLNDEMAVLDQAQQKASSNLQVGTNRRLPLSLTSR